MIIKSMSRKQATFSQLVDYFEDGRQDEKYNIYHNIYSTHTDKIKGEFLENATYLSKRKNGVYMYHEILSITKTKNLTEERQKEILKDIGLEYIQNRAKNNLVFGVLHDDKDDNLHYHFMISSNELQNEKKHRLSKDEFGTFKKELEQSVLTKYPELEQKKLIGKEPGIQKEPGEKLSNKGVELKRRTGKTDQRDNLKERLKAVFSEAKNKADFFTALEAEQLSIYVRGNTIGILDKATDRKHRLNTLGLLDEFHAVSKMIEEAETVKGEAKADKNEFSKERIDTGRYRRQEQNTETKTAENTRPEKEDKQTFHTDRVDTRKVREQESGQKTENGFSGKTQSEESTWDYTNEYDPSDEIYRDPEPENEKDREIRKRKEAIKKARETEPDYRNDYSKGK